MTMTDKLIKAYQDALLRPAFISRNTTWETKDGLRFGVRTLVAVLDQSKRYNAASTLIDGLYEGERPTRGDFSTNLEFQKSLASYWTRAKLYDYLKDEFKKLEEKPEDEKSTSKSES